MASRIRIFLILLVIISLFLSNITSLPLVKEGEEGDDYYDEVTTQEFDSQSRGLGRFLAQKKPKSRRLTCNKFPKICYAKGSPGPHCCKKKCVNVLKDRNNCGYCGKKCKYNEICCNGKCVNPSFNRRHCGGCNNRCKNGSLCAFGLCNYA